MGRSVRIVSVDPRRVVRPTFALVCLVALFAALLVGLSPDAAQARQADTDDGSTDEQVGSYSVTATVDGDNVIIGLSDLSTPVGALELELRNVPTLANEECTLLSGMGACNQSDDGVRIVALNPTGWQESTVLLELAFTGSPVDAELVIGRGTDVAGTDLVGTASTTVASASSDPSGRRWLVPAAIAAVVGLLVVGGRKIRGARPTSHPE